MIQQKIIKYVVGIEGDYSNHRDDSGGKTRFGITQAVARRYGYKGKMQSLPIETAIEIYEKWYWNPLKCGHIAIVSPLIAFEVFDSGVNSGKVQAARWLQTALNEFNRKQRDYPDLITDGVIGSKTIAALRAFINKRGEDGEEVLFKAMNCQQGAYMLSFGEWGESFNYGWFRHRVGVKPPFLYNTQKEQQTTTV